MLKITCFDVSVGFISSSPFHRFQLQPRGEDLPSSSASFFLPADNEPETFPHPGGTPSAAIDSQSSIRRCTRILQRSETSDNARSGKSLCKTASPPLLCGRGISPGGHPDRRPPGRSMQNRAYPRRWPYGSSWGPALSEAEGFQGFLTQQLPLLVEKTLISFFQSSPNRRLRCREAPHSGVATAIGSPQQQIRLFRIRTPSAALDGRFRRPIPAGR